MTPDQIAHVCLIRDVATVNGLPALLLVGLAFLENEQFDDADETGDQGNAFGLFQMNIRVWGIPAHRWHGLEGTRASMDTMMARWTAAYAAAPLVFEDDPAAFLLERWKAMQGGSATLTITKTRRAIERAEAALAEAGEESSMAVEKPPIIWLPAHPQNVNVRPAGIKYEGCTVHTTAGGSTIQQLGAWFGGGNIAAGLRGSTHFGVARDGSIGQFVRLDQQAIAHGNEAGSTAKLVRENPGLNANSYLIGIEHLDAGVPGSVTPAQLEASAWLIAWLWETEIAPHAPITGAVLDRDHLLQHRDLAPISKPLCASWPDARMDEHIMRIRSRLVSPLPPVPPDPPAPEPTPDITIEQVKLGMIRKLLDDQYAELAADLAKITGG